MLELRQIESFYPQYLRGFKKNLLREYLQYKILEVIFSSDYGRKLNFMGGTAIHIIYSIPRFSEDLDFDNKGLSKDDFRDLSVLIGRKLSLEGYMIEAKNSFKGAYKMDIRFGNILYENRISGHKDEKILIQVDADPQKFEYAPEHVFINKFEVFTSINAVPLDILLAQKLLAILKRKRAMGRDFYDAIFLFGKTKPNLAYLKAKAGIEDVSGLKKALRKKCSALNFKQLADDVRQFLFFPDDSKKVLLFEQYVERYRP